MKSKLFYGLLTLLIGFAAYANKYKINYVTAYYHNYISKSSKPVTPLYFSSLNN